MSSLPPMAARDKSVICKLFFEGRHCPIRNCPYAHIKKGKELPVPTSVCRFYLTSKCLKDTCIFFHAPEAKLETLRGSTTYKPEEVLPIRDPFVITPESGMMDRFPKCIPVPVTQPTVSVPIPMMPPPQTQTMMPTMMNTGGAMMPMMMGGAAAGGYGYGYPTQQQVGGFYGQTPMTMYPQPSQMMMPTMMMPSSVASPCFFFLPQQQLQQQQQQQLQQQQTPMSMNMMPPTTTASGMQTPTLASSAIMFSPPQHTNLSPNLPPTTVNRCVPTTTTTATGTTTTTTTTATGSSTADLFAAEKVATDRSVAVFFVQQEPVVPTEGHG
jgi:hypothetical protein